MNDDDDDDDEYIISSRIYILVLGKLKLNDVFHDVCVVFFRIFMLRLGKGHFDLVS